ncbi:Vitamin B12 transporter BtuB [Alphaproteobacteria bacterium SO-S41]|nr:Vitamin B12 transporter BtuB [Alphaproteobacteria bacterium SO-S41]
MSLLLLRRLALAGTSLALVSGAAVAQEKPVVEGEQVQVADAGTAAGAGAAVEEITVTAERRATNLQKTAIAISAFSGASLEDKKIANIRDLAGYIPNLSISRVTISHTTQTYSLRGVGEGDPIQEPVLAVYVDDVYVPRQIGSMSEFNDLERVEVLRGPQGTLYGRNSSAGALRIITRDPGDELRVKGEIALGNLGAVEARALVEGPIIEGKLAGSLSYIHHSRDGTAFDPTLNHDVNRIDLDAIRGKLRWTPNEALDILFTVNLLRDRSDSRSYIPVRQPGGGFDPDLSFSEVEPSQDLDQISGSLRIKYDINDRLNFKSISSYGGFNLNPVNYDNDGEAALIQKNLIHYNDQYYTQEFQLNGDYGAIKFTGGVFYLHERFYVERDGYSRRNALNTDPVVTPGNYNFLRAHNITNTDAYAIFGEATWAATEKLSITAGLRWTYEEKTFTFDNRVLNLAGQPIAQSIKGEATDDWSAFTPKLTIQYQWTDDLLQYVTYSQGFKSGGFDNRATRLDLATLAFEPETVSTYETGLKGEFFDHALRANLAVFYNDYTDLQVSFFDPVYVGSRRGNAGQAHTYGVELETDARLSDNFSLQFAAGYLYAIYDEYKGAGGAGIDADGNRLVNSPRFNLSGGFTYDVSLGEQGSLRFGANAVWQTKTFTSALPAAGGQNEIPPQAFVNAVIAWTAPDEHWTISLSAKNLFDSEKPVSSTYTPSTGVYYLNFPDPRTVLVSVKYEL